jgi:hypothetical protein
MAVAREAADLRLAVLAETASATPWSAGYTPAILTFERHEILCVSKVFENKALPFVAPKRLRVVTI